MKGWEIDQFGQDGADPLEILEFSPGRTEEDSRTIGRTSGISGRFDTPVTVLGSSPWVSPRDVPLVHSCSERMARLEKGMS